jgi:hypothetical protein
MCKVESGKWKVESGKWKVERENLPISLPMMDRKVGYQRACAGSLGGESRGEASQNTRKVWGRHVMVKGRSCESDRSSGWLWMVRIQEPLLNTLR